MKLSDFDYILPKDLIAQYPLKDRAAARLMVVDRKTGDFSHLFFEDINGYLKKEDLVVLNDTRVLTCRLIGRKSTGGKVEVLLTRRKNGSVFEALIQPSRTKIGERINFGGTGVCGIITNRREISFSLKDAQIIYELGQVPLPPYIKREPEEMDKDYYQTIYARSPGAIASPTAGLHFTQGILDALEGRGVRVSCLTLHVGLGTFKPVTCEDVTAHRMEKEFFKVPEALQKEIKTAKERKSRILAVGTTSLRALESYALGRNEGHTDLFILPGYKFKIADSLLTNFHLPKTTLFMLVCAFAGETLMKEAYRQAVDKGYRFYSYGDAMLII